MKPAKVKRALEILEDALELSGRELDQFLDEACGEDASLRREVVSYLDLESNTVLLAGPGDSPAPEIPNATVSATRYELHDEIARGGMGVVFRAFDNNIRRNIAVKILRSELEDKPDTVRRFLQEAQISGQLEHPSVPPVHEIGRLPDGRPFIAMKLVNGATLEDLLAQRIDAADDQARLLSVFEQVCQAIAFAHRRGVIHRDLKPSNVMVGEFGEVQVMDWGIAKLLSGLQAEPSDNSGAIRTDAPNSDPAKVDTDNIKRSTRVGQIIGTPAYMAPEQSIGRANKTADVFSLGALLCEILTGDPPYQASSSTKKLAQATLGEVHTAHEHLRQCGADHGLIQLAIECLDADVDRRPPDASHLKRRITAYLESTQERVRQAEIVAARTQVVADQQRRMARLRLIMFVVGFALVLAGTVLYVRQQANHAKQVAKVQMDERKAAEGVSYWSTILAAFREVQAGDNHEADRILSRSPQELREWEWYYLHGCVNSHIAEFAVPDRAIAFAVFMEDGTKIALIDEWSRTQIVDSKNGKATSELDPPEGIPLAVSADGNFALTVVGSSDGRPRDRDALAEACVLWEVASGKIVQRFDTCAKQIKGFVPSQAAVSPTGKYIACPTQESGHQIDEVTSVTVYDAVAGRRLRTFPLRWYAGCSFGPNSQWFVASTNQGIQFWDLTEDRAARPPIRTSARILRCSWDRSKLAGVDHDSIRFWDLATNLEVPAQRPKVQFPGEAVSFREDGNEFVAAQSNGPIQVWDSNTGELVRTIGSNKLVSGHFSRSSVHDDRLIVPSFDKDGTRIKLFDLMPSKVFRGHTLYIYPVVVSSDGRRVFSGSWDKTARVWDGETGTTLFSFSAHDSHVFDLDYDERSSQVISMDDQSTICLWDAATGEVKKTRQLPVSEVPIDIQETHVTFTPDGKSIFAVSDIQLLAVDSSTLETHRELDLAARKVSDLGVSPSGDHVGIILYDGSASDPTTTELKILDADSFREVTSFVCEIPIRSFEYSPDGSMIAMGFCDGSVGLWNLTDLSEPIWLRQFHSGEVFALVFTPDGSRLFSGGRDSTIRIWDTTTGEDYGSLLGHENYVYSLDITADGCRLVSGSGDGTVRIWDAKLDSSHTSVEVNREQP